MTYPRAHLIDPERPGFYHLVTRCVRRAWLCGRDPLTGRSFEHRRHWLEDRIHFLSQLFCTTLYGHSVMSNHCHIVVRVDPKGPWNWADEEVARRWLTLYPPRSSAAGQTTETEELVSQICSSPERLACYRERLGSLSWFMRCLSEPIARQANAEDGCKGRFWEGRFKSQALLDEQAVLACLAYVDLNAVRAGICDNPEEYPFSSIHNRISQERRSQAPENSPNVESKLGPVADGNCQPPPVFDMTLTSYRDWLNALAKATVLQREFETHPFKLWKEPADTRDLHRVMIFAQRHRRAFGAIRNLRRWAQRIGRRWVKGVSDPKMARAFG